MIANKSENEDLFWAVRGGGGNFGVVTEFVLRLHEQRKTVYAGMLMYPGPLVEELFKVAQQWWEKGPSENEGMLLLTTRGPPPERMARIFTLCCRERSNVTNYPSCIAGLWCDPLLQRFCRGRPCGL